MADKQLKLSEKQTANDLKGL
jgi:hypothetical protein